MNIVFSSDKKEYNTIGAACKEVLSRIFDNKTVADKVISSFAINVRRQQISSGSMNERKDNERKDNERKDKRVVSFSVR